ncbi:MAG TPA: DNA translocase FtsK 4TM domain-containing protein [Pseudobacter sp.]|nr:DNA translocase FtsK 4TM domain-containing protein [Pseudobacter sp.]
MANRLKSSKSKSPDPEKLKPEQEVQVTVKELVKDERTHKIAGTVALLLCAFFFIAFVSYLFTWSEDYDKVHKGASILLPSTDVKTSNLLGNIGAYVSHQFFYNAFGIASFLFCSFFFVLGVNGLFGRKLFSIGRNLRYLIAGILYISVAASFFAGGSDFRWGGALGNMISEWLVKMLGNVGTFVLLFAGGLAYVIWRFNPTFKVPSMPKRKPAAVLAPANVDAETGEVKEEEQPEEGKPVKPSRKNKLNKDISPMVAAPVVEEDELPLDLKIIEKEPEPELLPLEINATGEEEEEIEEEEEEAPFEEEEEVEEEEELEEIPEPVIAKGKKPLVPDLELEIKTYSPEDADEEGVDVVGEEPPPNVVLAPYDPALDLKDYKYPSLDLLEQHGSEKIIQDPAELENNKNQIINTLKNYDIHIQKISATVGPTVTLYEIVPAAGVRISRIKNLEDDIALSLAALGIRIIAPIPGKGTIGIEVPNVKKTVVSMKSLLASEKFQFNNHSLPVAIGKKIDNDNFIVDLATMPHLLMAGATGQGKSVGLNAILVSLLYKKHPSQLKLVLVDPKKVELSLYRTIERHFLAKLPGEEEAIITDTKKVINTLNALCIEMDNRYDLLKEAGTRNIKEYNEKFVKRRLNPQKGHQYLPFIVLVVDEFADLIMTAGKEVEMPIARLAQLARAVGIHLIIATQRPSVNIITGTIKANFPARIAFKVSSKIDSRTILDTGGAEQLIGKGDMLISYNGELTRLQCAFVDTPEVDSVCESIGNQNGYPQAFLLPEYVDEKDMEGKDFDLADRDSLFEDAARLIVASQIGSTSLLQRRMKLGYNRAGRLMDQLEGAGIVGPSQGSKARDVLIKTEMDLEQHLANFL